MSNKMTPLISMPLVESRATNLLIDYLIIKVQKTSYEDTFNEMMLQLDKNYDKLPNRTKRVMEAIKLLYGEKYLEENMKKAHINMIKNKSNISESIIKEWDVAIYSEVLPPLLVWLVAIITILAGLTTIYTVCQNIHYHYGSSEEIAYTDENCREEEKESEIEIPDYEVEYACYDYYDRESNYLYTECDEPEGPDDVTREVWSDKVVWEEPIHLPVP